MIVLGNTERNFGYTNYGQQDSLLERARELSFVLNVAKITFHYAHTRFQIHMLNVGFYILPL